MSGRKIKKLLTNLDLTVFDPVIVADTTVGMKDPSCYNDGQIQCVHTCNVDRKQGTLL